jgi:alanyl-tRNA synthetase
MATDRLYYNDCYLQCFDATVVAVHPDGAIELDRSAFYPESGGQSHDTGLLNGQPVQRVVEDEDRLLHFVALGALPGDPVKGEIDWARRHDLMQHHTGQHLLSAVAEECFGWGTVGVHMSPETATVELAVPDLSPAQIAGLEEECNRRIQQNLPVRIVMYDSAEGLPLRKATQRTGPIRVVSIGDLDHSACGGTHLRATGEVGVLVLGRAEKIRKNTRIEFACGMRAVRQCRQRTDWLSEVAAVFQTAPQSAASLAAAQRDELLRLNKQMQALQVADAARQGREARARTGYASGGTVYAVRFVTGAIGDAERAFAQAFCGAAIAGGAELSAEAPSVLLTAAADTGAFLLCASSAAGFDAKAWLAEAATTVPAKGGGTALMVSGRIQQAGDLPRFVALLPVAPIELPRIPGD